MKQEVFWRSTYDDLNLELARRALNRDGIFQLSNMEIFKQIVNDDVINVFDVGPKLAIFQYRSGLLRTVQDEQIEDVQQISALE
jgi:hypothetical protein